MLSRESIRLLHLHCSPSIRSCCLFFMTTGFGLCVLTIYMSAHSFGIRGQTPNLELICEFSAISGRPEYSVPRNEKDRISILGSRQCCSGVVRPGTGTRFPVRTHADLLPYAVFRRPASNRFGGRYARFRGAGFSRNIALTIIVPPCRAGTMPSSNHGWTSLREEKRLDSLRLKESRLFWPL